MSTILKALRRLEEDERRKSETQNWVSDAPVSHSPRRRFSGSVAWLLCALAVLIGAGIGVGLRGWWVEETPSPSSPLVESRAILPPVEEEPALRQAEPRVASEPLQAQTGDANTIPHVVSRAPGQAPVARSPIQAATVESSAAVAKEASETARSARVVPETPAAKSASVQAVAERPKTPVASGPSRPVEALPLAVASSPPASPSARQAEPRPARSTPPPAQPVNQPVKLASVPTRAAVMAEKMPATPAPTAMAKPVPLPAKASPPSVSAAAAATLPDSLKVAVITTTWHPNREKRSTVLSRDGSPSDRSFAEGDFWMEWKVVEIKLSGVSFERDGVRVERKVGSGSR